jgi:peptidyl-prolyl cis-trans isomerase SurA
MNIMPDLTLWSLAKSRRPVLAIVIAAMALIGACRSKPAAPPPPAVKPVTADTWAVVEGQQITRDDVDKAYRRTRDASQPLSDEETLATKLSLLNDLITEDLLINKAQALKIDVSDSEIDTAYGEAKKNIPDEAFQKELAQRNVTTADMREGLRRSLLTQKVMEREIGSKINISDQDVNDFFNSNRAQFNVAEEAYHLAQIVVTAVREPQPTNRTGDDAATPQAAAAKVNMLMERLKSGAQFQDLAMDYSEDPESAPRGGDLGLVPVSRLKQVAPQLRDAVLKTSPGSVSMVSAGGVNTILLVVSHEAAGQRDLSTPGVKEQISRALHDRREQLLRAAYLTALRSDANVTNYLARRIVEAQGKGLPAISGPAK